MSSKTFNSKKDGSAGTSKGHQGTQTGTTTGKMTRWKDRPHLAKTPYAFFNEHRAKRRADEKDAEIVPSNCGFHWHATRLTSKGTNFIFNDCKQEFQSRARDGKIEWNDCKEILFSLKRELDRGYRNMMWHFKNKRDCFPCEYWDTVYRDHLEEMTAIKNGEPSDSEILEAVSE
uniref:Non-structural protein NP-1 n=1 Tax=Dromedary camel bocaparvovirus 2 TaxID=2014604 RepID=A0A1Z3FVY3_9VIRU|nr:NP1 [Dromedary camel bocaparvovirus 2]